VRIIAGTRKGHTIRAPRGRDTRPTSDRVRENVFNIVAPWLGEAAVLDLFAGSGAMGLEALSRGAARAVFVEADAQACRAIDQNLDRLRLTGAQVLRQDVARFLPVETRRFDLVFCDPPYDDYERVEPVLARHLPRLLEDDGVVVLETSSRAAEPELPLTLRTTRRYGAARITLYQP
jgi:16S rRNA (guanine(966)-N(2))-methyltransferase RsmD